MTDAAVIVAYYLGLLDDAAEHDRKSSKESSAEPTDPRANSQPPAADASNSTLASTQSVQSTFSAQSFSSNPTSISEASEDDSEGPHKRRASPTELSPERRASDLARVPQAALPQVGVLQRRGSAKRVKKDTEGLKEDFRMSPSPGPSQAPASTSSQGVQGSAGSNAGSSVFGSSF